MAIPINERTFDGLVGRGKFLIASTSSHIGSTPSTDTKCPRNSSLCIPYLIFLGLSCTPLACNRSSTTLTRRMCSTSSPLDQNTYRQRRLEQSLCPPTPHPQLTANMQHNSYLQMAYASMSLSDCPNETLRVAEYRWPRPPDESPFDHPRS